METKETNQTTDEIIDSLYNLGKQHEQQKVLFEISEIGNYNDFLIFREEYIKELIKSES